MELVSLAYHAFTDASGNLCKGGQFYLYEPNSNQPASGFLNIRGDVSVRQWPIPLDNNGVTNLWLLQHKTYRIVVKNNLNTIVLYENSSFRAGEATSEAGLTSELLIHMRAKTIIYANGRIDEVRFYKDDAKTLLVKTRKFMYNPDGTLDCMMVYDKDGNYFRRRQLDRDVNGTVVGTRMIEETTYLQGG